MLCGTCLGSKQNGEEFRLDASQQTQHVPLTRGDPVAILTASVYNHRRSPVKSSAATPAAGESSRRRSRRSAPPASPPESTAIPTRTKQRKYWGGEGDEDPVTATDDFIWNKEFVVKLKRLIRDNDGGGGAKFWGFELE